MRGQPDQRHGGVERGVEDETMACGTGAVASAAIAALRGQVSSPVQVTTSGGEKLLIHFDIDLYIRSIGLSGLWYKDTFLY